MSSLYKLSIQGIRSFDGEKHETIQFGFPLTLICGQNGCGKTTIIECLKYATTGDLPPNSKGGAFIHDPNIANRNIVHAQVKLAFRGFGDKSMIVQRSMQLSKKRGRAGAAATNTFKTLEGQLSVISKGVKTSKSSKNAELDTMVPQYLGASKAVLDYVIFCHQDDSLWPLSEASVLKKRFDDIFEALKFTKVLDNLKLIRKDMTADVKLIEQSVQHLKIDKTRANKINDKLAENRDKVDQFSAEIASLTVEIEKHEDQASALFQTNQEYQETLSRHERLKLQEVSCRQALERLLNSMVPLTESDDELNQTLANFSAIEQEKATNIASLEDSLKEKDQHMATIQKKFHEYTRLEGSLASREQLYNQNLKDAKSFMETASEKYGLLFDSDTSQMATTALKDSLQEKLAALSSTHSQLTKTNREAENASNRLIREVLDAITKEEQHMTYCADDVASASSKIKDLKRRLDSLNDHDGKLEIQKSQLESLTSKFEERKTDGSLKTIVAQIESDEAKLSAIEHETDDIARKLASSNKQSDMHAKLDVIRESNSFKKAALEKIVAANNEPFTQAVGVPIDVNTCDSVIEQKISEVQKQANVKQNLVSSRLEDYKATDILVKSDEATLAMFREKHASYKSSVLKVIKEEEIEEYEEIVGELEEDHNATLHNLNTFDVSKTFKIKAIEIAKSKHECSMCLRPFEGPDSKHFINLLEESLQTMSVEKFQENVDNTKKELEKAKSINSDVLQYRKLSVDIHDLEEKVKKATILGKERKGNYDIEEREMEELTAKLDNLSSLRKSINSITRIRDEIRDNDKLISGIEEELSEYGASSISISELQKLHQLKNLETRHLRQSIDENKELRNQNQRELSRLESNIKDAKLVISDLEKSLADITNIKFSIKEHEAHIAGLRENQEKIDIKLKDLYEKRDSRSEELVQLSKENKTAEEKTAAEVAELKVFTAEHTRVANQVNDFEQRDFALIKENNENISSARDQLETLRIEKGQLSEQIKVLQSALNDSVNNERNIRDNLELRAIEKELDVIIQEISQLDITNAEIQKESYQAASRKLRNIISDLNAEYAGKVGEIKQIKDQIKQLQKDLSVDFKDINKVYHEEWVKLQTNLLVSNDLATYSKALDNAIMKYHSIKMENINRILAELWSQTYKGTDIDSIEIKTEVNMQAKGNRSYNYRVVMYKGTAELDMRGRCSAGQKVLTSILIRLALAECFGSNCGMIALDEPTTNLDLENAEALAMALNKIVEVRKDQKNFQLIVITHDEKFLSHINGDRYTDHFYRIHRDENQKSEIKSLPIHLIQDE